MHTVSTQVMVKLATNMDDDADQQNGMGAVAMPPGGPAKHVLPQMQVNGIQSKQASCTGALLYLSAVLIASQS